MTNRREMRHLAGMGLRLSAWMFAVGPALGCSTSAQEVHSFELAVAGAERSEVELEDGTRLLLDRADLAFGPFTLCPGNQAGDLCSTARFEWLDSAVVDLLDPSTEPVGQLEGFTGPVRSYMYDYGFASSLTLEEPRQLTAARQLGGASLVLEGTAVLQDSSGAPRRFIEEGLPFLARVAVRQGEQTEKGQPVVRKSTSERFQRNITTATSSLTVRFDLSPWLSSLSADELLATVDCSSGPDAAEMGFGGMAGEGGANGEGGMAGEGGANGEGCVARIAAGSRAHRALINALTAGARPEFTWSDR